MSNRKRKYADLNRWRNTNNSQNKRYYARTSNAENGRKSYSKEELDLILKHDITDTELSKLIGRSVKAIQVKRSRLKEALG